MVFARRRRRRQVLQRGERLRVKGEMIARGDLGGILMDRGLSIASIEPWSR